MFIRTLLAIFALTLSQKCIAVETLTLAAENSWPPYSDKNGISKDIIQAAYKAVNVKVKFIAVPYARALKMTELGQVDGVFNVTKQKNTTDIFNFGNTPIFQATASFYYRHDSTINFTSTNEIPNGTSVGVIIGYEYGDNYEANKGRFSEVRVANQIQLIELLIKKRIEVAIMFDEVVKSKLEEMGLTLKAIKKGETNHKSNIYVAFSKLKNTHHAMKLLDEGLVKIKK
jgi:polar amino acid transport system substrate-binding protein